VSVVLRQYRSPDDYEALIVLWGSAGEGIHLGDSDSLPELTKKYEHDPELFLVADNDGEIVGSVIGGFDGRRGLIYHLAVKAEERRRGLGSSLMDEIEVRLRGKGCRRVYLLVTDDNRAAMRFYEKRGWGEMNLHVYAKNLG
jgi:ribosomal protein S18 acetylase RimI-like enzyme